MSILTEQERRDVYKYWLHSSTLTDEDGLIQIAERAVLEKLAGVDLPKPIASTLPCNVLIECKCGESETCTQKTVDLFTADQMHQAYAQGAASQLMGKPIGHFNGRFGVSDTSGVMLAEIACVDFVPCAGQAVYTLKESK